MSDVFAVRVDGRNPRHWHLSVYNRGGLAGALCVDADCGEELMKRIEGAELTRLREENQRLRQALEEIAKGEGPYSRDQLTHAGNVIDNLTTLAKQALGVPSGEKGDA